MKGVGAMQEHLKIAYSRKALETFGAVEKRDIADVFQTDFTDVAAVVVTDEDGDALRNPRIHAFEIPVFLILSAAGKKHDELIGQVYSIIDPTDGDHHLYARQIEGAADRYESGLLPPFFKQLMEYVERGNTQFDCPGHQGGAYFRKHPAGRIFYNFYGENTFRADLCNADVAMGDLLIHEGPALEAQRHAARVFHADKTYFVLTGTSGANKVVLDALLAPGDIVLYERNNHKSISYGALIQAGAVPVYLETARNPFGSIGGILEHCFNEQYIRMVIAEKDKKKAKAKRPVRVAVIQLGNYDGCIYNARQIVEKIGHLCDYIYFDSAWVGYEQFIPMLRDCSPLLLNLGPDDPGIIVSQSVHKHQAGFSMSSQIHKKDAHIKGQERYLPHKRLNNSFMVNASTSPFYQVFASLDMNARIQEGEGGALLWKECMELSVEARKAVIRNCKYLKPLVPPVVHGKNWEEWDTEEIINDIAYFTFEPGGKWHSFQGYGKGQYFIDPMKLLFTTPGINVETGRYEKFGIPGIVLANYLRENAVIPEKCDLNDILFIITPAETKAKINNLISRILHFEAFVDNDAPMAKVLPNIYHTYQDKYAGYTIRRLCQEMHDFYKERKVNVLQKHLFLKNYFPIYSMSPQEANYELVRGHGELIDLAEAEGRVALEGEVPYPPGVPCIQPGEKWSKTAIAYFMALAEVFNLFPGFTPELQGVYMERAADGKFHVYAQVLKKEYEKIL